MTETFISQIKQELTSVTGEGEVGKMLEYNESLLEEIRMISERI